MKGVALGFLAQYFGGMDGRAEAFELFGMFSRFEFALKRGGFCLAAKAAPDWDAFARELSPQLLEKTKASEITRILFDDPAKKLVKRGDSVGWQHIAAPADNVGLLLQVRRIRNNLFHGEKISNSPRDRALISAALFVLDETYFAAEQTAAAQQFTHQFQYAMGMGSQ